MSANLSEVNIIEAKHSFPSAVMKLSWFAEQTEWITSRMQLGCFVVGAYAVETTI